ncbi:hypothetical protein [Dysgonomonas macrotermitis]|uniref:SGNH/GDSL hydrolase family protein n=1 Tax=Dysgonomonas macrotermitis TaxID=1346286 RepID=A0A1M5CHW0_9BACT|nr:hypothetical protein [Dysgonomonas macrotermitis]SHF54354.1 hypothetical protein SAMN05444362_107177 [Dysgonomonas macrotermitis]
MVKKTLLLFFILFAAYTLVVVYVADPNRYISEHQWQDNQIKTQRYLFSDTDSIEAIIVGSSLCERLYMNQLPHFYNLGLLGLSSVDGLFTVVEKGVYPKYIFVEMNHIDRSLNEELKTSISNPLMTPLRHYIPSLRDGKQPMSFIAIPYGQKATAYGVYLLQTGLGKITASDERGKDTLEHVDMLSKILPQAIEYHSKVPENLEKDTQALRKYVDEVILHGSTVVFFEMPVQYQLCGLSRGAAIREQMYKTFPRDEFHYIDMPDCNDYTTTDGDHLDALSAEKYTRYFRQEIDSIKSLNK